MHHIDVDIVDVSDRKGHLVEKMPSSAVHWFREHSVHDLKMLMLEMHSAGEDITEYTPILAELEKIEKELKMSGDLPATCEEDLDPLEYVEKEMKEAFG